MADPNPNPEPEVEILSSSAETFDEEGKAASSTPGEVSRPRRWRRLRNGKRSTTSSRTS